MPGRYVRHLFLSKRRNSPSIQRFQFSLKEPTKKERDKNTFTYAKSYNLTTISNYQPVLYASHASPNVYMEGDAKSETDILHIRDLPKISVHLSTRDTENMLSFLTVPYLRVPLLL
eukprot:274629-Amorphochlora_amoeboformis.AAC.1